jgi:cation diffusion facilitator CzcD-associated flavoprotein CzcO
LILAKGAKEHTPPIPGIELATMYSNHNSDPNYYNGKKVLILGKGNSAMETATNIHGTAKHLFMFSPN